MLANKPQCYSCFGAFTSTKLWLTIWGTILFKALQEVSNKRNHMWPFCVKKMWLIYANNCTSSNFCFHKVEPCNSQIFSINTCLHHLMLREIDWFCRSLPSDAQGAPTVNCWRGSWGPALKPFSHLDFFFLFREELRGLREVQEEMFCNLARSLFWKPKGAHAAAAWGIPLVTPWTQITTEWNNLQFPSLNIPKIIIKKHLKRKIWFN